MTFSNVSTILILLSATASGCGRAEATPQYGASAAAVVTAGPTLPSSCPKLYAAYLPYPMEVCELPDPFPGPGPILKGQATGSPSPEPAPRTTPKGLCTIKNGPWYAELLETPSCLQKDFSEFELVIAGPQTVEIQWAGTLEQAPPPINPGLFSVPTLLPCTCCPGFRLCQGECRRKAVPCPGPQL